MIGDESLKPFGTTQVKGDKIYYGGSKINNFVFDWLSNSYYIDNDEKN